MEFESDIRLGAPMILPENANVTILYNGHHILDTYPITIPATTTLTADAATNQFVAPEGYVMNREVLTSGTWKYTVAPTTWPLTVTKRDGSVKSYETVTDGLLATRDGDIALLNEDTEEAIKLKPTDTQGVSSGSVTVDLGGHTGYKGAGSAGGCELTIINGSLEQRGGSVATKTISANGGSGVIILENTVSVNTNGVAIHSSPSYNDTTAEVIVNGGTYVSENVVLKIEKAGGSSGGVARTNTGKITINGGSFTGAFNIVENGQLIIKGGDFNNDPSAWVAEGFVATYNEQLQRWFVTAA